MLPELEYCRRPASLLEFFKEKEKHTVVLVQWYTPKAGPQGKLWMRYILELMPLTKNQIKSHIPGTKRLLASSTAFIFKI